jgi:4-hydroxy-tetrahydrodipicolinate synthase
MTQTPLGSILAEKSNPARIAQGVWPVMFTPFRDNGSLDLEKIPELVEFYISAGCAGIFAVAGSGEMFQLTQEERLAVAEATLAAANGRVQVVAGGNFAPDLAGQIQSIREIATTGVDAVILILSIVPIASEPWDAKELVSQTLRIAESVEIPLGMYECPYPEHRILQPEDVSKLAASGRFHFLKETTEKHDFVAAKVRATEGTPLRVFPANPGVFMSPWIEGIGGFNGIIANVIPEVFVRMHQLAEDNQDYCNRMRDLVIELEKGFLNSLYPASGKFMLQLRGLSLGTTSRSGSNPVLSEPRKNKLRPLLEIIRKLETIT